LNLSSTSEVGGAEARADSSGVSPSRFGIVTIGLLTGSRLDAICSLTVKDVDARDITVKK